MFLVGEFNSKLNEFKKKANEFSSEVNSFSKKVGEFNFEVGRGTSQVGGGTSEVPPCPSLQNYFASVEAAFLAAPCAENSLPISSTMDWVPGTPDLAAPLADL